MKNRVKALYIILIFFTVVLLTGCRKKIPQERISEEIGVDCSAGEGKEPWDDALVLTRGSVVRLCICHL